MSKDPYAPSWVPAPKAPGIWVGTHQVTGERGWRVKANGKRKRFDTLAEAKAWKREQDAEAAERKEGGNRLDPKLTFGRMATEFYLPAAPGRPNTLRARQASIGRVQRRAPWFMALKLSRIRATDLERLATTLERDYKPNTVNNTLQTVTAVCRWAVADGRLTSWTLRTPNRKSDPVRKAPRRAEFDAAMGGLKDLVRVPVMVAASTGLRPSELCGLTVENLPALRWDMAGQQWALHDHGPWRISVTGQITARGALVVAKSDKGHRTVPLGRASYQLVVSHLNRYGTGPQCGDARLLWWGNGRTGRLAPPVINRELRRVSPPGFSIRLHGLRHFYATLCAAVAVAPKELQRRMGHAEFATTMDLYADAYETDADPAEELFGTIAAATGSAPGPLRKVASP